MGKRLLSLVCFSLILGYFLLFLGISLVFAQPVAPDCDTYCGDPTAWLPPASTFCLCPPTTATTVESLLENVINYIFWFATAITPILVLVGGFYFITSGGSIEKVSRAKRIILYTIVGYAIVLFARGLVYVLADLLGQ